MLPDSDIASALPLFLVLAVVGVGILGLTRVERGGFEISLFLTAYAIRFAASLAIYEGGIVDVIGDEDAQGWIAAWSLKRYWEMYQIGLTGLPSALLEAYDTHNHGYMFFLAAVYFVWDFADPGRLVGTAVNSFAGALTVTLVYRAALELFDRRVAVIAGWLTCVFPSLIIWSAQTIKEPIVILLETFLLYICLRLFHVRTIVGYVFAAAVTILLLVPFRFYGAYLAGAIVLFTLVLRFIRGAGARARPAMLATGVLLGAIILAVTAMTFAQREASFDFEYFSKVKRYSSVAGGSSVEQPFDVDTPAGLVLGTIYGAIHVLFAPLPWQWTGGSARLAFTIPEVTVWWVVFAIGVWPGLRRAFRDRFIEIQPVLLFLVTFGFLYGAMFGNVGLAFRQRAQLLPWLLLFAAAGLEERWRLRRERSARGIRPSELVLPREESLRA